MTEQPDDIRYLINGQVVRVVATEAETGRLICSKQYDVTCDDDEEEAYIDDGDLFTLDEQHLYAKPPVAQIDAEVARMRQERTELELTLNQLHLRIEEQQARLSSLCEELEKVAPLENIRRFLQGPPTHFVHLGYRSIKIITREDAKCRYHKDGVRLLVLYGNSKGDLAWQLNTYKDGSGSYQTVYPCYSEEEARAKAKALVEEQVATHDCDPYIIQNAHNYGVPLPEAYLEAYAQTEIPRYRKVLDEQRQRLRKAEADYALVTTDIEAYALREK